MLEPTSTDIQDGDAGAVRPDHYYDGGNIPVFKPTMQQFKSFPEYIKSIDSYGMKSGIVKVIPPTEWLCSLPPMDQKVRNLKIQRPIEQHISGSGGVFYQANIEKSRTYNLQQWRRVTDQSSNQPPARRGELRKGAQGEPQTRNRRKSTHVNTYEGVQDSHESESGVKTDDQRSNKRKRPKIEIDDSFDYRFDSSEFTRNRCSELEKIYWKTITYNSPMYGADMLGSLFDDSTTIWNVSNLDNLLRELDVRLPGVNSSYLYFGMWKSTFSWHLEDMDLYSINYIHFGAPKQWYSISQSDEKRFYDIMKNLYPDEHKKCKEFLRHKTFLVSPSYLASRGIKVNRLVHYQQEFVITFPFGYHSGFNLGYNCAESVNFATEKWLEYGFSANKCRCISDSVDIDVNLLAERTRRKQNAHLTAPSDHQLSEDGS
ncbi:DNA damage-responsive transcriptional repressor RPH1 [Dipodascopsis tothii]|uniref:DNA damage-responsive transcriptional repressor RPH1 n=1 Tax=Dipodascopsis tothii TaxID=44089 RepID=UPI0034CF518B